MSKLDSLQLHPSSHACEICPMRNQPYVVGGAHQIGLAVLTIRSGARTGGRHGWAWVPGQNGDIGDDNKIIIELVKAPKREEGGR